MTDSVDRSSSNKSDQVPARNGVAGFHRAIDDRIRDHGQVSWRTFTRNTKLAHSTVRGWLDPKTGLISQDNLRTLLTAAEVPNGEIEQWMYRHAELQTQFGGTVPGTGGKTAHIRHLVSRAWTPWGGLVAGLVLGGAAVWMLSPSESSPGVSQPPVSTQKTSEGCGGLPLDLRQSVLARIGDTSGRGARTFGAPNRSACLAGSLSEGREIRVVCLALDGEAVDEEIGGKRVRTTAWAKMTSGAWVLALYTDLPYTDGSTLVAGLPAC